MGFSAPGATILDVSFDPFGGVHVQKRRSTAMSRWPSRLSRGRILNLQEGGDEKNSKSEAALQSRNPLGLSKLQVLREAHRH